MSLRIGSIVIDCYEFDKMYLFWQGALGYIPREPSTGGWAVLWGPAGKNPNLSLNQVQEKHAGRNWLHFDLYTKNRELEIDRLLQLGAIRHPQSYEPEDDFPRD
jgi:hypothetical protein